MAQQFQNIGQESPEVAAVARRRQGWQGQPVVPAARAFAGDGNISFRGRRANTQALGFGGAHGERGISSVAGYQEPSMAAEQVGPRDSYTPEADRP